MQMSFEIVWSTSNRCITKQEKNYQERSTGHFINLERTVHKYKATSPYSKSVTIKFSKKFSQGKEE